MHSIAASSPAAFSSVEFARTHTNCPTQSFAIRQHNSEQFVFVVVVVDVVAVVVGVCFAQRKMMAFAKQ